MITRSEADETAALFVAEKAQSGELELALLRSETQAVASGWVYRYATTRYLETSDDMYILVGSGPFLVLAECGGIYELGTALPVEAYLAEVDKGRRADPPTYLTR